MAYDEDLAERVRHALAGERGITEKKMFGGLAFLVDGHLSVSAAGRGGLMLRCEPAQTDALVAHAHVERFVMRGRAMDGWLYVGGEAVSDEADLQRWVDVGVGYARSLPPRTPG